jgi:uncharacterized protein YecE (DUF72 family)
MNYSLGTVGFSYGEWADVFYPPRMPTAEYLAYYARSFDAVELDTTFYAMPPADRVRRWCDATPPSFRFCPKVTRTVTHELPTAAAVDDLLRFVDAVRGFGDKLGPILMQFPPSFGAPMTGKLEALLIATPKDVRLAVELRDRSWGTQRTLDLLSHHRAAYVSAEYQHPPRIVPVTTDFLYIRWIGVHGRYRGISHEVVDTTERLNWWLGKIRETHDQVRELWGFFANDYAGYGIGTCERFKRLAGEPVAIREQEKGLFD